MQLGTRWTVGTQAPASVPESVRAVVASEEQALVEQSVDASSWRWTLTWLERRAVVELDDGTIVKQLRDGSAELIRPEDDAD